MSLFLWCDEFVTGVCMWCMFCFACLLVCGFLWLCVGHACGNACGIGGLCLMCFYLVICFMLCCCVFACLLCVLCGGMGVLHVFVIV